LGLSRDIAILLGNRLSLGTDQATVPGLDAAIFNGRISNQLELDRISPNLLGKQDAGARVPRSCVQHHATIQLHGTTLPLYVDMIAHLVFKIFARRTMCRAEMADI
jgi:hypothetical protein